MSYPSVTVRGCPARISARSPGTRLVPTSPVDSEGSQNKVRFAEVRWRMWFQCPRHTVWSDRDQAQTLLSGVCEGGAEEKEELADCRGWKMHRAVRSRVRPEQNSSCAFNMCRDTINVVVDASLCYVRMSGSGCGTTQEAATSADGRTLYESAASCARRDPHCPLGSRQAERAIVGRAARWLPDMDIPTQGPLLTNHRSRQSGRPKKET